MGSQFDELAKAIARGASRRTVLRGIVGGLLGAVAASLIPRGPSEAVEAKPAKEYEAKMGNPDEFIRRSFESLWAYLSPDA